MSDLRRFNATVHEVEGAEEERTENYITASRVHDLIDGMSQDDEIVIQRTTNAEPGAIYP